MKVGRPEGTGEWGHKGGAPLVRHNGNEEAIKEGSHDREEGSPLATDDNTLRQMESTSAIEVRATATVLSMNQICILTILVLIAKIRAVRMQMST